MAVVKVKWADDHLKVFGKHLRELNRRFPTVLPRIVNQVGDRAKTQVIRNLTKQTGLQRKVIVKAVGDPRRAHGNRLSYEMVTRGGNIRLKYLDPKETPQGVTARAFGKRTLYPGSFLKGGAFPARKVVSRFDGHAFYRLNPSGSRITFARSGVFIPKEMTTGATRRAFLDTAGPLLQTRVAAAIQKLLK